MKEKGYEDNEGTCVQHSLFSAFLAASVSLPLLDCGGDNLEVFDGGAPSIYTEVKEIMRFRGARRCLRRWSSLLLPRAVLHRVLVVSGTWDVLTAMDGIRRLGRKGSFFMGYSLDWDRIT